MDNINSGTSYTALIPFLIHRFVCHERQSLKVKRNYHMCAWVSLLVNPWLLEKFQRSYGSGMMSQQLVSVRQMTASPRTRHGHSLHSLCHLIPYLLNSLTHGEARCIYSYDCRLVVEVLLTLTMMMMTTTMLVTTIKRKMTKIAVMLDCKLMSELQRLLPWMTLMMMMMMMKKMMMCLMMHMLMWLKKILVMYTDQGIRLLDQQQLQKDKQRNSYYWIYMYVINLHFAPWLVI